MTTQKKRIKHVGIFLKDEDEEDDEEEKEEEPVIMGRGARNAVLDNRTRVSTVKPVLRGHLWDKDKMVFYDRTIKR